MIKEELQVLETRSVLGLQMNIYGTSEAPIFLAKDVAEWIEHSNPRMMLQSVDEDEKGVSNVYTLGGMQEMWTLTEDGLYEVLMQSRKPIAKQFKKQVKNILKDVRRHGGYLTPEKIEDVLLNPDTLIKLATNLKAEQEKRLELERTIIHNAPKVQFADAVSASKDTILIGDLAKILKQNGIEMGARRLFEWMRQNGFLMRSGSENIPTQRAMEMKLFEIKESVYASNTSGFKITRTTKVTGKGQQYFVDKFLKQVS